jgi:cobalt-zinc-cadmium efflux system membrane fusion protein
MVDADTRTITVRMDVPNPTGDIKPQMLANLLIRKQGAAALVVPGSAVVREDDVDHVFVETGAGRYELRKVDLGTAKGDVRPVLNGVKSGDKVVVEGAFHLNNERLRKELE